MQFTLSLAALVLASFAAASPTVERRQTTLNQCNTGEAQCCQSTQNAADASIAKSLGPLSVILQGVTGLVGLTCNPITAIGVSGTSCSAQPVCCTNNSFNGVVALGCTPINANL